MTKWTPGPWFPVNIGSAEEPMMDVKAARIAGQKPRHCVAICATGDSPQPMETANAHLISSAPELYEALEQATNELNAIRARDGAPQHIDWYQGRPLQTSSCTEEWWNELTEKCFAALKKARGEQS